MDINLSAREQKIKTALVNYTVSRKEYFTENFERLLSKYFSNAEPNYTKINEVWDTFFSIARDDEKNYEAICNDLEKYIENGTFNFEERGNISNTYEYYLQRLLIHIDDKVYKTGNKFRKINQREPLDLAGTIKEFVDADGRAGFYPYNHKDKIDGSHIVMTFVKFDQCREWRNQTRVFHPDWVHLPHELMPKFIEAFFLATIVYNYTKDIAAGFSIKTRPGSSVKVFIGEKTIFKIDKIRGGTIKIPVKKEYFGDSMKTTVEVVISAIGFSVETNKYEIERGRFNRTFYVTLKKELRQEKPEKQKNRIKEEEKPKELQAKDKQQNELNNNESREGAEPKKKQKTANPHYPSNGISRGTTPLSEFIKKYWIWLAGIAFLALVTFTILRIGKNIHFSSEDEVPAEQSAITATELYPILDGRSWVVKEMEGIKLPKGGSAKIVSMNDEGTECRMVIDTDFASQHREINLQYNRQTGDLSSPELGKGKVEKVTGFVSLIISFKGWTIEK